MASQVNLTTGICGFLVETDQEDWIFYPKGTSAFHQAHVILHEISHLLLDHDGVEPVPEALVPDIDPVQLRAMLTRSSYDEVEERDAEMLATSIWRLVLHGSRRLDVLAADVQPPTGVQGLARRFIDVLDPVRWPR